MIAFKRCFAFVFSLEEVVIRDNNVACVKRSMLRPIITILEYGVQHWSLLYSMTCCCLARDLQKDYRSNYIS